MRDHPDAKLIAVDYYLKIGETYVRPTNDGVLKYSEERNSMTFGYTTLNDAQKARDLVTDGLWTTIKVARHVTYQYEREVTLADDGSEE